MFRFILFLNSASIIYNNDVNDIHDVIRHRTILNNKISNKYNKSTNRTLNNSSICGCVKRN